MLASLLSPHIHCGLAGKGRESYDDYEPVVKGKAKGKAGKAGKGKSKDDEPPPLRRGAKAQLAASFVLPALCSQGHQRQRQGKGGTERKGQSKRERQGKGTALLGVSVLFASARIPAQGYKGK